MRGSVTLHKGDCLEVLDSLPSDHFDGVATDPPYHLQSIVDRFGKAEAAPAKQGRDGGHSRASKRFQGKTWDSGDIAFRPETWAKVARVLKPGGHLVAFNHSRKFHRMAVALEDAGLEYREMLAWVYGSGLPQNQPTEKALEKMGATPEEIANWEGWGTVLRPSIEPIALVRKPLSESSIARQCLATRTGAINLTATAIPNLDKPRHSDLDPIPTRYPGNLLHDGSPDVMARFPVHASGLSASRFFYCAKANKKDRRGSEHPTVKPQALMEWLIRLIVPRGARILDPFGGSGSTGWAAENLGVHCDLIERDPDYQADILRGISDLEKPRDGPALSDPAPDALPGQSSLFCPPLPSERKPQ